MKLIIAGGRDFDDFAMLTEAVNRLYENDSICTYGCCKELTISEIVCGMAKGADLLGRDFAIYEDIPVKEFPADWEKYGRAAGPTRNMEMGDYADELLAFWDLSSTGTKHMITYMMKLGKPVHIVPYIKEKKCSGLKYPRPRL